MIEPVGKWLVVESVPSRTGKTLIFYLRPKDSDRPIGHVGWWGPWRRYAFQPAPDTVFEADCLAALSEFCARKTREHRGRALR